MKEKIEKNSHDFLEKIRFFAVQAQNIFSIVENNTVLDQKDDIKDELYYLNENLKDFSKQFEDIYDDIREYIWELEEEQEDEHVFI